VTLSRREFVAASSAAAAALAGCDGVYLSAARHLSGGTPESFARPDGATVDPDFFFLQRATFGPAPGDLDRIRSMGRASWLEEQLHPERVDDAPCALLVRRFESLHHRPGDLLEFKRRLAEEELSRAAFLRAVHSRRQLFEVLVEFWSDHLNIFHGKGNCAWFKTADDRDVVRAHALGRFRDLIRASALSPAMLVYLDGHSNHKERPNENYARELLELHTLGVHGGYTQKDVMEVSRCLTGWTVTEGWRKGRVIFDRSRHDDGVKTVLGQTIPAGGGEGDLDRVLDIVTRHPSTARYVATKLCRRLVSDDPPAALVERVAARFTATDGDLRETARETLSDLRPGPLKFKRPFRFLVSALRGLSVSTLGKRGVLAYLERMGQAPFQYPTPDGYPDETGPWLGTLLWRWNFALNLVSHRVPDARPELKLDDPFGLFPHLVGRRPTEPESRAIGSLSGNRERTALILASPAFQWY
jgi:uncharacterized protein (DUF1800 family)